MHAIYSKKPIEYAPADLNNLISILISNLLEDEEITRNEADVAKQVFNTIMEMIVDNQEICDEILEQVAGMDAFAEQLRRDKEEAEAWDAVEAAERIAKEAVEKENGKDS